MSGENLHGTFGLLATPMSTALGLAPVMTG